MTGIELYRLMFDSIFGIPGPWHRELSIDELNDLDRKWRQLMVEAKPKACDHPPEERYKSHCFKCGSLVEFEKEAPCLNQPLSYPQS